MLPVSELLEDIKAIRTYLDSLTKEIGELRKHIKEQAQPASRSDLNEILVKIEEEVRFIIDVKWIANEIQKELATPAKLEAVVTPALNQMRNLLGQLPTGLPVTGKAWGFINKQSAALTAGVPLLLTLLTFWCMGLFSRVPQEQYQLMQRASQKRAANLAADADKAIAIGRFYENQIKVYRKKYPKSATYFPEYVMPKPARPSQK